MTFKEISIETVRELMGKLKALKKGWAEELSNRMIKSGLTDYHESRIYNIVNNGVSHQESRREFVEHATAYLAELVANHNEVADKAQEILEEKEG